MISDTYLLFSKYNENINDSDISYLLNISLLNIDKVEDFFEQLKIITNDEYIDYEIISPEIYHKIKNIIPQADIFVQNFYRNYTKKFIQPIQEPSILDFSLPSTYFSQFQGNQFGETQSNEITFFTF